ncbi:hypothetical protein ACFFKL_003044 [Enterobacter hormaechei]
MAIGWPVLISGIAYVSGLQAVHPLASTSRISLRIHPIPKHSSYAPLPLSLSPPGVRRMV